LRQAGPRRLTAASLAMSSILPRSSHLVRNVLHRQASRYLGSCLSADGSPAPDVAARSASAWLKWKETTGVLCDKLFPRRLKSMVYKTMVRPVAIYGAECRPATKSTDQTLNVMEMNMLRWSLGVTRL